MDVIQDYGQGSLIKLARGRAEVLGNADDVLTLVLGVLPTAIRGIMQATLEKRKYVAINPMKIHLMLFPAKKKGKHCHFLLI